MAVACHNAFPLFVHDGVVIGSVTEFGTSLILHPVDAVLFDIGDRRHHQVTFHVLFQPLTQRRGEVNGQKRALSSSPGSTAVKDLTLTGVLTVKAQAKTSFSRLRTLPTELGDEGAGGARGVKGLTSDGPLNSHYLTVQVHFTVVLCLVLQTIGARVGHQIKLLQELFVNHTAWWVSLWRHPAAPLRGPVCVQGPRVVPLPLELLPSFLVPGLVPGKGPEHALLFPCEVTGEVVEMIVLHHLGLVIASCPHLAAAAAAVAEGDKLTDAGCCTAAASFLVKVKELVLLELLSTDAAA